MHMSCAAPSAWPSQSGRLWSTRTGGIDFVGTPVFGRQSDAENGQLWIIAGGDDKATDDARPLLATFSRGITVVGKEPRRAWAR